MAEFTAAFSVNYGGPEIAMAYVMTTTSISNLSNTYLQSFLANLENTNSTSGGLLDPSSILSTDTGSAQNSTFAQVMSAFQQSDLSL